MKKYDFSLRVGFLLDEVGHLYTRSFDQQSRERLGLSHAQCRLIGVVASNTEGRPSKQSELAQQLGLSPMGVTSLCDRMEAAGWIQRGLCATDKRANSIELREPARAALEAARMLNDEIQENALRGFTVTERERLTSMLQRIDANLQMRSCRSTGCAPPPALGSNVPSDPDEDASHREHA